MNPTTLEYLRAHQNEEPEALAAALAADYATVRPIDRKALAAYLLSSGLVVPFRLAREHPETSEPLRQGLLLIQDIVASGIDSVGTDDPAKGAQMAQLLGGLQQAGLIGPEHAAEFLALGGGYRYERLTVDEVEEQLTQFSVEAARAERQRWADEGYGRVLGRLSHTETVPTEAELVTLFAGTG